MARKKIGEILQEAGLLDERQVQRALIEQQRWGGQLGRVLVDLGMVREDELIQALSRQRNLPVVSLDEQQVPRRVSSLIAGEFAEENGVIPFRLEGKFLDVAMVDPTNLGIVDELRIRTQLNIRPYLAGPKAIERALARVYARGVAASRAGLIGSGEGIELDDGSAARSAGHRDAEIRSLQERLSSLEALVKRDEDVIRKLLGLLIEKGVASRDEILEKIK